jgi:hypothetical protein
MITAKPLTRSLDRVFILCGMADEPTWPGRNPSVANSCPTMRRTVVASDDGAAASWASAAITAKSIERG